MKKLILILAILLAGCSIIDEDKCYYVTYENGKVTSRNEYYGPLRDTIVDLYIKSWYEHYDGYAVRRQITYEILIECD